MTKPYSNTASPKPDPDKRNEAENEKATQFDGNPNPQGSKSKAFKPEDDTPMTLKKKSGPSESQKEG